MLLEEIVNTGREKSIRIAKRSKLKSKRMNPIATKQHNPREAGVRPSDPSSLGHGEENTGQTGLAS